jgi:hypothetical protein
MNDITMWRLGPGYGRVELEGDQPQGKPWRTKGGNRIKVSKDGAKWRLVEPRSSIPCQLAPSPMMIFPVRVEHALDVTVQRPHDANPGEHHWPAKLHNQQQRFHRCLPFFGVVFCLRQLGDVGAGVLQRGELATARQRGRIVERSFPAAICRLIRRLRVNLLTFRGWMTI